MSKRTTSGADLDLDLEPHRLVGVPVVVDGAFGPVRARREPGDLGADAPLRVLEQLLHRSAERRVGETPGQRLQPPHARCVGRDLGSEVTRRLVLRADLRQDQPEDVVHDLPAGDDLYRRDDHALLEDLLEGADRRRRAPADIDVVREVRHIAEQPAVDMDRRDETDVVQVDAARVRVVRHDRVTGTEVLRAVASDGVRHLLHHRPQVHGLRERLRDGAQLRVEERAREVGARLDVRRVGTPLEREHHLVRRRDERVPDHLERDRIHASLTCRGSRGRPSGPVALMRAAPRSPPRREHDPRQRPGRRRGPARR